MNKIVLVTGGSRGIGRATSMLLAKAGYTVCVNYLRNAQAANDVVDEIEKAGGQSFAVQADISDKSAVDKLFAEIDKRDGVFYGLVNNAGILAEQSTLADMSLQRVQKVFATNVMGAFLCTKAAVRRMSASVNGIGGAIVNISSIAAKLGAPNEYIDYAMSKGAIESMTLGLAKELAVENIRVNAVRPGFIDTEIHKIPGRLQKVTPFIPMQRAGQSSEIAEAVLWLLSEQSSYTSGAIIDIAGGR